MFELFDLPNEKELAQIMLEGAKKAKSETNAVDTKTIFPFWEPPGSAKKNVVSPDKTGAVKVKPADFKAIDTATAWKDFLDKLPKKSTNATKDSGSFGTVVVDNGKSVPKPDDLIGKVKALKETKVTDMSGKTKSTTEELGLFKELVKSNAAEPNKDKLVGIVKPKTELGKIAKKPKFDIDASATVEVKDVIPAIKQFANKMTPDKTGAVKPKSALGVKGVKGIKNAEKPELYDDMTQPQLRVINHGDKIPSPEKMFNHYGKAPEVKVVGKTEPKGSAVMSPDKTGVVKQKGLETAKRA
jgi:hypothetical protein